VGVGVCLFALAFEDFVVVPSIAFRRKYAARVRGENMSSFLTDRYNLIVFGEDSVIYKIGRYSAGNREMHTVMVLDKDDAGNVAFRIDAEGAAWGGESWVFRDGVIRRFGDDGSILEERSFSRLPTGLADPPQYFARDVRKVTNMTILEGYRYIQVRRRMGFGYRRELTEYHRRIAGSVALFFVVLIGLSLGSLSFKNTFVISFSLTLVSVLVFYFVVEMGYVFGKNGRIPPAVGGWMGNIVFSTVGAFLVTRIRK
jgi:lipopolysaccharide export system permease protein